MIVNSLNHNELILKTFSRKKSSLNTFNVIERKHDFGKKVEIRRIENISIKYMSLLDYKMLGMDSFQKTTKDLLTNGFNRSFENVLALYKKVLLFIRIRLF